MSETIDIRIAAPQRGQFIQLALMPLGTPELLVGDRVWVRRIRTQPTSQLHVIEAWGESAAIERLYPSTTALGLDEALLRVSAASQDVPTLQLDCTAAKLEELRQAAKDLCKLADITLDETAAGVGFHVIDAERYGQRVEVQVFAPWRAPWLHVSVSGTATLETITDCDLARLLPGQSLKVGALLGCVHSRQGISPATVNPQSIEEIHALRNATAFEHFAIVADWPGDFMGWPVVRGPWTVLEALDTGKALGVPENPNEPGVRSYYGTSLAPMIWCQDGVARENLDRIVAVGMSWLDRQAYWHDSNGAPLSPWPARKHLSMHKGMPWIDNRNDPFDALGYTKQRGSNWASDSRLEADHQHENGEILALATLVSIHPALRFAARAKAVGLSYERSWVGALDASWQVPFGRGAARTHDALLALSHVSEECRRIAMDTTSAWMHATLRAIRARGIRRELPAQVGSLQPDDWWTVYEEGLLALTALRRWRMFGDEQELEVAYLCGRHVATGCFFNDRDAEWTTGYEIKFGGDGWPRLLNEEHNPRTGPYPVKLGGWPMSSWAVSGLNAFLAAAVARPEKVGRDDPIWLEVARRARESLTQRVHDSSAEALAQVQQTLWACDIGALGTRGGT